MDRNTRNGSHADHTNKIPELEATDENFAETIKFLDMKPSDNESNYEYYHRLKLQAEKTANHNLQDRMIRDRLIQAINDPYVREELAKMKNSPSAADVLAKQLEFDNDLQVWHLVIPYLSLADVFTLIGTSNRLKRIIERVSDEEKCVTIDDQVIQRYPVADHFDIYSKFGGAATLTIRNVKENDMDDIFAHFFTMQKLTMININIIDDKVDFPVSLKELVLVNLRIEKDILNVFLKRNNSLLTLSLANIQMDFGQTRNSYIPLYLGALCPQLESLSVKDCQVQLIGRPLNELKSLKIAPDCDCCNLSFPQLEYLYQDTFDRIEFEDMPNLKSFTTKCWDGYQSLKNLKDLEYLKVIQRVDPKFKEEIDSAQIKTVDVYYYDYAVVDQPNLILRVLNEDCLRLLLQYLDMCDCESLAETHSIFEELVLKNRYAEVDEVIIEMGPGFFKRIGPFIQKIRLTTDTEHPWILPCLTGLKTLSICGVSHDFLMGLPTPLYRFEVSYWIQATSKREQQNLQDYFLQMDTLRELATHTTFDIQLLTQILTQNKESLVALSVKVYQNVDWDKYRSIWELLGSLKALKQFQLLQESNRFTTSEMGTEHLELIFSKIGKKLQVLDMTQIKINCSGLINGAQFPNLRELCIWYPKWEEADKVGLCSLKELRKLVIYCDYDFVDDDVSLLIKSLPLLSELNCQFDSSSVVFGLQLCDFLREKGRRLVYNWVSIP